MHWCTNNTSADALVHQQCGRLNIGAPTIPFVVRRIGAPIHRFAYATYPPVPVQCRLIILDLQPTADQLVTFKSYVSQGWSSPDDALIRAVVIIPKRTNRNLTIFQNDVS
jgi:hypothetical protein